MPYSSSEQYIGKVITTSTYTVLQTDEVLFGDTSSNSITLTLPASGIFRQLTVTKTSASNTLTIDGNGSNISGQSTYVLDALNNSVTLVWDGSNYYISYLKISDFSEKSSLVNNDIVLIEDSESSYIKKKTTLGSIGLLTAPTPNYDIVANDGTGTYTTTSTSPTAVNTSFWRLNLTTSGNPVVVGFAGADMYNSTIYRDMYLGVSFNSSGFVRGLHTVNPDALQEASANFEILVPLSAGTYTIDLYFYTGGNTLSLRNVNAARFYAFEL